MAFERLLHARKPQMRAEIQAILRTA